MADKIRFGLKNTKYAIYDESAGNYGELKDFPGAVSLSLSREGGDSSDFYADDGVYYTFAGTNGGYSADFEVARVTDAIRRDILGEIVDSTAGVQFEVADAEPAEFALVTEMQTNDGPIGFVFYSCKASRIELSANTKGESPDVDTDTLNLRIGTRTFPLSGVDKPFVQGHILKTSENAAKYTAFFNAVVLPTA